MSPASLGTAFSGLTANTTNRFRIRACDNAVTPNCSAYSNIVETIVDTTPPGVPTSNVVSAVTAAPPPTVIILTSPSQITSGGNTALTWTTTNATDCTASGSWSGTQLTANSIVMSSIASGKKYTLTCSGPGGSSGPVSTSTTVVSAPGSRDLIMTATTHSVASVTAGSTFSATFTAKNQGTSFTPSSTVNAGIYLSADITCGTNDTRIGTRSIWSSGTSWGANASTSSLTPTVTVPSGTAKGKYYVCIYADHLNSVSETYEANNGRVSTSNAGLITVN